MSRIYEALLKAERERSAAGGTEVPNRSWIRVRPPTAVEPIDFAQPAPSAPTRHVETPSHVEIPSRTETPAHVETPSRVEAPSWVEIPSTIEAHSRIEAPSQVVGAGRYSRASDQFQVLASHLQALAEQDSRVVMVTSSAPAEGKSFVSLNLAITLARLGRRVLLVDIDLRNPKLHHTFNLAPLGGLTGYLLDNLPLESCLSDTGVRNLTLVATSSRAALFSSEILASPRMRQFVADVRAARRWDYVVLDSAPVLAASETQIVAHMADNLLFVVAANRTGRGAIARSLELLKAAPLLGLVFNRFEPPYSHRVEYGYGYGYGAPGESGGRHGGDRRS